MKFSAKSEASGRSFVGLHWISKASSSFGAARFLPLRGSSEGLRASLSALLTPQQREPLP